MVTNAEVAQLLEDAADALWMYGRCVGKGTDDDGRLCVLGAIAVASGLPAMDWNYLTRNPVVLALGARVPGEGIVPIGRIFNWNDETPLDPEHDADLIDFVRHVAKDIRNGDA